MSLGGRLSALKKKVDEVANVIECDDLVVGSDLYSLELYSKLKEKSDSVKLVSPVEFYAQNIRPFGPSQVRGNCNIEIFRKLYPEVEFVTDFGYSKFFKDQKWREFGGRSKSEKLLDGEEFYTSTRSFFDWKKIFNVANINIVNQIKDEAINLIPLAVSRVDEKWKVKLSTGVDVIANRLFWGKTVKSFTDLISDTHVLPESLFEFADTAIGAGSYLIDFELDSDVEVGNETIFIPLSYTHDWGHFIGECSISGNKSIEFMALLDVDELSEDEIAKRIKLLKRSIDKIFPDFSRHVKSEYITVIEDGPSSIIVDEHFNLCKETISNLYFVGNNAPIDFTYLKSIYENEVNTMEISHMTRALISIRQALVY